MMKTRKSNAESPIFLQSGHYGDTCWCPAVDIYRAQEGWLIKIDLAGVMPQDVQVSLQGRRLLVRGVRRDLSIFEGLRAYSMEISYNRFERWLDLPAEVAQGVQEKDLQTRSEYRDGMFLLWLTPVSGGRS